jgi:N-formylglutamate amidohydrolase
VQQAAHVGEELTVAHGLDPGQLLGRESLMEADDLHHPLAAAVLDLRAPLLRTEMSQLEVLLGRCPHGVQDPIGRTTAALLLGQGP